MSDTSFGLWIKQRRRVLDLTQEDLAERVGYAVATIRKFEAGTRRPSRELAGQLAEALELGPPERSAFVRVARLDMPAPLAPSPAMAVQLPALPAPATPFVGRAAELEQLGRLLADPNCRLITLTGPGGVGKSRLALEAAARVAGEVSFVALAPVATAEALAQAIAGALNIALHGSGQLCNQLPEYLSERELLLVLDNMEHLLASPANESGAAVDLLAAILARAAGVKLLVTSRERLRLQGEWQCEISGLPVPTPEQIGQPENSAAVALFAQQARRSRSDFRPSRDDWLAIARICRLLEGLPLAIELAAAWVRAISCEEIAREIEQNLDFLAGAARDLPARHRSPRAIFDHSWNLLGEDERRVLRRLAIFRGGFTRAAAAAICGEPETHDREQNGIEASAASLSPAPHPFLPILASLIDKSLLTRDAGGRYHMHELIRQGAEERLKANPREYAATRDQHSVYYSAWLHDRQHALRSAGQAAAVAQIGDEIDNLRQAIAWATSHAHVSRLRQSMRALCWFYELRGWLREGDTLFEQLAAALRLASQASDAESAIALGQSLAGLGWFRFRQGQLGQALDLLRESVAILRAHDAPQPLAESLAFLGFVSFMAGHYPNARRYLQEGHAIGQAIDDSWIVLFCQSDLGKLAYQQGDHHEARRLLCEAIDAWRAIGDPRALMCTLTAYSALAIALGQYDEARQLIEQQVAAGDQHYDSWSRASALDQLGALAIAQGDYVLARDLLGQSLALFRAIGDGWHLALALNHMGCACFALGQLRQARRCFEEALELALTYQLRPAALEALEALAEIMAADGAANRALEVLSFVAGDPASSAEVRERARRRREAASASMPASLAEAAWQRGRAITLAAAITLARDPDWLKLSRGATRAHAASPEFIV
jgi:predicted ATPase/DNA-binding XRE family transcriptional regulator